jgi:hypothetical protein
MPEMAILALSFFDRGMYVLHSQIFISKLLMASEAIFAYKPLSPGRCASQCPLLWSFRAGIQKDPTHEKKYSQDDGFTLQERHVFSSRNYF